MKFDLRWPYEDKSFGQRESPPELDVDRSSQNPTSGNAKVDMARYKVNLQITSVPVCLWYVLTWSRVWSWHENG